ncbi:MAG: flagellar basal body-associated FliL family protein [Candidatus Brocadiaceae bacterium]|uniref:flagellar basal body-associated FliL family protein n=1 Tax=Candidatus Wunengus sp. YC61 TaxID=3367698 RepID=UPI002716A278|nr:flagellar basal body-associated FliL family protein [Candidatus Brocadiaceae bacterium]
MAEKKEKITKEENKTTEQPAAEKKKGNKTIIMMGIVILISIGGAFVFVSKVYPSLAGNVQPDAGVPENSENQAAVETADVQTVKQPETKKEPASASKKKEEKGKEGTEGAAKEESLIAPVETLIVNLSGSNGRRYLRTKINLEAKDGDVKKLIETKSIQIKDRLISILSSKTLEEIDGLEAQENLRKEIKDAVDVVLKVEGVLQVYFTEFVVQ